MKAIQYKDSQVVLSDVDKPQLQKPTDAILRVTSAAICGSDLHMYENRAAMEDGKVLGHEIMGVVEAVGDAVQQIKAGDRVVLPFNIGCGNCAHCLEGFSSECLFMNDDSAGAGFGYAMMGPYDGGQTEFVRVPNVDWMAIKLPGQPHDEYEDDFLMVADIFPTAFHACKLANVTPGKSVAIVGAGPVGLLSVVSAKLLGSNEIYIIDHIQSRLDKAKELGAIPVNMSNGDPVEQIINLRTSNRMLAGAMRPGEDKLLQGVECGIDAIGYQSHSQQDFSSEDHIQAVKYLATLVLPTGSIGLAGVYLPADPGETGDAAKGIYPYPLGEIWDKNISVGTGQCPVKKYALMLRNVIIANGARPGTIVSDHINIEDALHYYERFDKREAGIHKGVITFKTT